jgi:chitodextrinase
VDPSWEKRTALKATKVTADSMTLEWPPASDNTGKISYRILVNDVFVGETDSTTFIVQSLEPGTSYTCSVVAEDQSGNRTESRVKKVRTRKK